VAQREVPWLVEPEEQPLVMMPLAEVMTLEMRHMTKPEREVAVAELEHETALAEVTRFEGSDMSEPECKTTVAEVPEVPRLERTMLSEDATAVELGTVMSQMQFRPGVPREMARTEASVTCLSWLQGHCQCPHDSCEQHHFAHRVAP
jgi:hypothetical protein